MNKSNSGGFSVGFCGLLTIALIVLKLCEIIDWSWWWVFAPLWLPVAVVIAILIIMGLLLVLGVGTFKAWERWIKKS